MRFRRFSIISACAAILLLFALTICLAVNCWCLGTIFPIFVDRDGHVRLVVWIPFAQIGAFHDGKAPVGIPVSYSGEFKRKWGYMDLNGNMSIPANFDRASEFKDGVASVQINHEEIWIDTKGKTKFRVPSNMVTTSNWSDAGPRIMKLLDKCKVGAITNDGTSIVPFLYTTLSPVSDHLFKYQNYTKHGIDCGYLDEAGNPAFAGIFRDATDFKWGAAAVMVEKNGGQKWALIDKQGNFLLPPNFTYLRVVSKELCAFSRGASRLQGLMDRKGNEILAPKFLSIGEFHAGLASASIIVEKQFESSSESLFGNYGYIKEGGDWAIPPQFWRCSDFSDTESRACIYFPDMSLEHSSGVNLIDSSGRIILKQNYQHITDFSDGICGVY